MTQKKKTGKKRTHHVPSPYDAGKNASTGGIAGGPNDDRDMIDPDAIVRGDVPMSLVDHLNELRTRLITCLLAIFILTIAAFYFSEEILAFISEPFTSFGQRLNIFKLAGGFLLRIKIAFFLSIIISLPLIFYEIWRYIRPAVSLNQRIPSRLSVFTAVMLFYGGILFVFFALLPLSLRLFLRMIGDDFVSKIGANDYIDFLLYFGVSMGLIFEFPMAVYVLTRIGILTPYFLMRNRKYSYVLIWIIAALITPQDILAQVLVAIPLMILYESSIGISKIVVIRKKRKEMLQ